MWAVDSAASHHMCHDIRSFDSASIIPVNYVIKLGDDTRLKIKRAGTAFINNIPLFCLFVPQFRLSLISVSQLDTDGYKSVFVDGTCTVTDPDGHTFIKAKIHQGLYIPYSIAEANISTRSGLHTDPKPLTPARGDPDPSNNLVASTKPSTADPTKLSTRSDSIQIWHRRLAHLNPTDLKHLLLSSTIRFPTDARSHDASKCKVCIEGKHTQKFVRTKQRRATKPFEFIHSDLCGPMKSSIGGASYYIVYIDDFTRYTEGMTISFFLYSFMPETARG
jgi:hypothetical protein